MTDAMKVLVVILVVWVGLFLYLLKLDKDIARLGRDVGKTSRNPPAPIPHPERMRETRRMPGDGEKAESK